MTTRIIAAAFLLLTAGTANAEPAAEPAAKAPVLLASSHDEGTAESSIEVEDGAPTMMETAGAAMLLGGVVVGAVGATLIGLSAGRESDELIAGITLASAGGGCILGGIALLTAEDGTEEVGLGGSVGPDAAAAVVWGRF
jgi:hypothetical protein